VSSQQTSACFQTTGPAWREETLQVQALQSYETPPALGEATFPWTELYNLPLGLSVDLGPAVFPWPAAAPLTPIPLSVDYNDDPQHLSWGPISWPPLLNNRSPLLLENNAAIGENLPTELLLQGSVPMPIGPALRGPYDAPFPPQSQSNATSSPLGLRALEGASAGSMGQPDQTNDDKMHTGLDRPSDAPHDEISLFDVEAASETEEEHETPSHSPASSQSPLENLPARAPNMRERSSTVGPGILVCNVAVLNILDSHYQGEKQLKGMYQRNLNPVLEGWQRVSKARTSFLVATHPCSSGWWVI
jgi:hypothetical protein